MSQPTEIENINNNNQQEDQQEEQDQGPAPIESVEEAIRNREVGVQLYNKNLFEAAIAIQMRVLEFYTKTYGDISLEAGLPYLDYGITLLAIIQTGTNDADAALAGNNSNNEEFEEDLSLCYENLDAARVCFEKGIKKLGETTDKTSAEHLETITLNKKRLAEVHDTLGDYFMEVDDEESAINSFNNAITIREEYAPNSTAIISGHYRIGKAYYRLQIYEEAAKSYKKAVDLAESAANNTSSNNNNSSIDSALIAEFKESLADAEEMQKTGGLAPVRAEVEQMFPSEDSDPGNSKNNSQTGNSSTKKKKNPLFEEIPKDPAEDSLQLAPNVVIPLLPTDASNSMSHFPSQGHSRASAGGSQNNSQNNNNKQQQSKVPQPTPVNTNVVIRRKTTTANASSSQNSSQQAGARREREGDDNNNNNGQIAPSQSQ